MSAPSAGTILWQCLNQHFSQTKQLKRKESQRSHSLLRSAISFCSKCTNCHPISLEGKNQTQLAMHFLLPQSASTQTILLQFLTLPSSSSSSSSFYFLPATMAHNSPSERFTKPGANGKGPTPPRKWSCISRSLPLSRRLFSLCRVGVGVGRVGRLLFISRASPSEPGRTASRKNQQQRASCASQQAPSCQEPISPDAAAAAAAVSKKKVEQSEKEQEPVFIELIRKSWNINGALEN